MILIAPAVFLLACFLMWRLDEALDERLVEEARREGWEV